eukprot:2643641-Rhodomonas_salina.1
MEERGSEEQGRRRAREAAAAEEEDAEGTRREVSFLPTYLPTYLLTNLLTCLLTCLPACPPAYLPTYLYIHSAVSTDYPPTFLRLHNRVLALTGRSACAGGSSVGQGASAARAALYRCSPLSSYGPATRCPVLTLRFC